MRQSYLFCLLFISFFSSAQIINFPDANFKALLLSASATETSNQIANNLAGAYVKIDANNDGEIQISEAHQIKYLRKYCNSCSESQKITSIEGIQNFINLTDLQLTYQHISNINVLNVLTNLQTINFASNWIENINLPNLTNLTSISFRNNYISTISLSNYKNLVSLNLENNLITFLNLNNLKYLNQILIANNPNLTHLFFVNYVTNTSFPVSFGSNSNVRYLCVDEFDIAAATSTFNISNSGIPIVINQYCETFYEGLGLNIVKGNVVLDQNNNGCDTNDANFKNLKFIVGDVSNYQISYTNQSGYYDIFLPEGNVTITPQLENPTYFTIIPTNIVVDFPTQTSPLTQNFCITPNGIKHDVEVLILPTNAARPGFNSSYKIIYKNKGNQVENGTIAFSYLNQDALDLVSVTPSYNSEFNDTFERTFYWQYTNLNPLESREINIVLNLNSPTELPALNSGDMLNMNASITPFINDEYLNDNEMPLRQIIVNSYDPNDKTCLEGNSIAPSEVGKYVHYMIRFENTGTFPAENIVVKDMIDTSKFDISSLVPLNASHNYVTRISGNKVEFIFENINLPFDNANNDGYIAFKIKTLPTLVLGNTFSNSANIYFDYNFPIVTNTATTTIAALNNPSFEFANYFSLYPNPTTSELNINLKTAIEINSIQIYNTIGQLVTVQTGNALKIDVSNLKTGNYFIKINTNEGFSTSQFIKE